MTHDINNKRTEVVNEFAEAGRAALAFDPLSAGVIGAIPDTEPQRYVVAGTLADIVKLLPAAEVIRPAKGAQASTEQVPKASVPENIAGVNIARLLRNLDETSYNEGVMDLACRLSDCNAVIKALLAAPIAAAPPAEEVRDTALLDALDAWVKQNEADGHHHFVFAFDTDATARDQIAADAAIRTLMKRAASTEGEARDE